jgi:undecaprenyl-diphosphatase
VGRLTPESIGWLVLNQRYLELSGIGRASAISAITLKVLAGGLVRVLFTAVVALMAGTGGLFDLELRVRWSYLFVVLLTVTLLGLVLRSRLGAAIPRMLEPVRSGARDLITVMRQPSRAGALFGASAGVTLSYPLLLLVGVKAFGADVDVLDLFAIYLGGTAVASASPTPGNLGAVEIALSAGLSAIGVAPATAIGAVMIYRLLTFWLPVIPGFFAFRFL